MQYGFYFNSDSCVDCKTCAVACKDYHDLPVGVKFRKVLTGSYGTWEAAEDGTFSGFSGGSLSVSLACNHCFNPACVEHCPTGAMSKGENGIVTSDPEVCIGCGTCATACPYGAPVIYEGISHKCDFCKDRLDEGKDPMCVAACPLRCLEFGDIDELRGKYGDNADSVLLPDSNQTLPNVVVGPHRSEPALTKDEVTVLGAREVYENIVE